MPRYDGSTGETQPPQYPCNEPCNEFVPGAQPYLGSYLPGGRESGAVSTGFLIGGMLRRPGRLAFLVVAGLALHGFNTGFRDAIADAMAKLTVHTQTEVTKHGIVEDTFALDQTCVGGYRAAIETKSTVSVDLPVLIGPADPEQYTTYKGDVSVIICPSSSTLVRTTDYDAPVVSGKTTNTPPGVRGSEDKKRVTITAKAGTTPWTSYVFPTNIVDPTAYKSWANFGGTLGANVENTLKSVLEAVGLGDSLQTSGSDMLRNFGQDAARMAAYEYVVKACANPAWESLKPEVIAELKKKAAREYNELNSDTPPITADDVAVSVPDTIALESQYAKQILAWTGYTNNHPDSAMQIQFAQVSNPPTCLPLPKGTVEKGPPQGSKL